MGPTKMYSRIFLGILAICLLSFASAKPQTACVAENGECCNGCAPVHGLYCCEPMVCSDDPKFEHNTCLQPDARSWEDCAKDDDCFSGVCEENGKCALPRVGRK